MLVLQSVHQRVLSFGFCSSFCVVPVWLPKLGSEIASSCLYVPFIIRNDRTNSFFVLLKRQIFATQLVLIFQSS